MTRMRQEVHLSHRANWLRAAVLGANDGIPSNSSLVLGVAGSGGSGGAIVTAGVAGAVAGALSLAAGEYVSVASQSDTEKADLGLERRELMADPEGELFELTAIYRERGLPQELAEQVARALSIRDAFAAHVRDELRPRGGPSGTPAAGCVVVGRRLLRGCTAGTRACGPGPA